MGMIKTDPTIDPLADGRAAKTYYSVEVKASDGKGWRRNFVEHETPEQAARMAQHFTKLADTRIVKVEVVETVVS